MERWTDLVVRRRAPRSLRDIPLVVLAGVAIFVIWAIVLAGLLLRDGDDEPTDTNAAILQSATATASTTPPQPADSTSAIEATSPVTTAPTQTLVGTTLPATAEAVAPTDTAAPDPTTTPEPATPNTPTAAAEPTRSGDTAPDALLSLLPTLDDLPDGFVVTNEESLTLDELAEIHPDPDMQRERLRGWGFTGAAERDFEIADGAGGSPDGLTLLTTLVVSFRTPDDARAAVEASHADAKAAENTDVGDTEIEPLGDFSRAASGTVTIGGEPLQVAYVMVQIGHRAITFAGGSPGQDPIDAVIDVVNRTLNGQ